MAKDSAGKPQQGIAAGDGATNPATIPAGYGAALTVDLDAVAANYRLLQTKATGAETAAVVKADAYGLGMAPLAKTLAEAGCKTFFVAIAAEGAALRAELPAEPHAELRTELRTTGHETTIAVLNGCMADEVDFFARHRLSPVINDMAQLEAWRAGAPPGLAAMLHVDSGMSRLGLGAGDVARLGGSPALLQGVEISHVISHLACADDPGNAKNAAQLAAFRDALGVLGPALGPGASPPKASLANSSGIFLAPDYHFDLVRAGAALWGLAPQRGVPNPLRQVVHLFAKILQVRDVDRPMTVGYGATFHVRGKGRIATVAAGYADGYLRCIGDVDHHGHSHGQAYIGGFPVPVVGRISMDLMTLDVSDLPPRLAVPGSAVELIGSHVSADDVADASGTIGYEILTRLGPRCHRVYKGGAAGPSAGSTMSART